MAAVRPVAVFSLYPCMTTRLEFLPLAILETRLAFMAFFIALPLPAFMAALFIALFMGSAMAGKR